MNRTWKTGYSVNNTGRGFETFQEAESLARRRGRGEIFAPPHQRVSSEPLAIVRTDALGRVWTDLSSSGATLV